MIPFNKILSFMLKDSSFDFFQKILDIVKIQTIG